MYGNREFCCALSRNESFPSEYHLRCETIVVRDDSEKGMMSLLYRPSMKCCPIAALHFRSNEDIKHSAKPHLYTSLLPLSVFLDNIAWHSKNTTSFANPSRSLLSLVDHVSLSFFLPPSIDLNAALELRVSPGTFMLRRRLSEPPDVERVSLT